MGNIVKKSFPVLNMHCAGCANNVEKTVKKLTGVVEASVNFATNTLTVSYESGQLTPGEIRAAVLAAGYDLIIEETHKKPIAIGTSLISGEEMIENSKGKAIENLHYVGDTIWDLKI